MKVLLVGGGGREHALAWKLRADDPAIEIVAAPGNPGIATLGRCVPVPAGDVPALVQLARAERPDLTVVGPEVPLALGLGDALRAAGLPMFGPTAGAARIESSKSFAKTLMERAGVPTARATRHTRADEARRAVRTFGIPVVIKATGLAAGKGVVIAQSLEEADRTIDAMLHDHAFGAAGDELLIEEFMEGEELSVFALTDGARVVPMLPAQDHKRLGAGDTGPNTGGMGAYAPVSIASADLVHDVVARIIRPTLGALRDAGSPFTGLLYAGLMLTARGPRVVEFNCRFGDPETEALMPLLESPLLPRLLAIGRGEPLDESPLRWRHGHAVTTVVAAAGYPESPRTGDPIALPDAQLPPNVQVFHAGTARRADGQLVSAGGRVLAITAVAPTFAAAQRASTAAAEAVGLDGKQFRADIGWRELARHAGAA